MTYQISEDTLDTLQALLHRIRVRLAAFNININKEAILYEINSILQNIAQLCAENKINLFLREREFTEAELSEDEEGIIIPISRLIYNNDLDQWEEHTDTQFYRIRKVFLNGEEIDGFKPEPYYKVIGYTVKVYGETLAIDTTAKIIYYYKPDNLDLVYNLDFPAEMIPYISAIEDYVVGLYKGKTGVNLKDIFLPLLLRNVGDGKTINTGFEV